MAAANPLWGAPWIHGELRKLGIAVAERTVSRLLGRRHRPSGQTWRTFLTNHVAAPVSMDFCTVPTVTGSVLFVLVLLAHHRRRIVHFGITDHPTAAWTAQQIIEAFPNDTAPRWLLRDGDTIYSDAFRRRVAGIGISEVVCAPSSPWQNPYAERLIGSLRRECLDHLIVLNRSAFAARARVVRPLLSAPTNTSLAGERRPHATTRASPDRGPRDRLPGSRRSSPSLRATRGMAQH
jgi:transposase InsO family protein